MNKNKEIESPFLTIEKAINVALDQNIPSDYIIWVVEDLTRDKYNDNH